MSHLKERGFGGSLSGQLFSAVHVDFVTEILNGSNKATGRTASIKF